MCLPGSEPAPSDGRIAIGHILGACFRVTQIVLHQPRAVFTRGTGDPANQQLSAKTAVRAHPAAHWLKAISPLDPESTRTYPDRIPGHRICPITLISEDSSNCGLIIKKFQLTYNFLPKQDTCPAGHMSFLGRAAGHLSCCYKYFKPCSWICNVYANEPIKQAYITDSPHTQDG